MLDNSYSQDDFLPLEILTEEQDANYLNVLVERLSSNNDKDLQGLWFYGQEKTGKTSLAYTISKLTKRNFVYVNFSDLELDVEKQNNFNSTDKSHIKELLAFYNEKIDNLLNALSKQNGPSILFIRHFDKAITHCQKAIFELFAQKLREYKKNNDAFLIFSSITKPQELAKYCNYNNLVNYLKLDLPSYNKRLNIIDYYIKKSLYKTLIQKDSNLLILGKELISQNYKCILAKQTEGFSCKDIKDFIDDAAIAIKKELPYTKPIAIRTKNKHNCCPTFLNTILDLTSENYDKSQLNPYECYLENYYVNQKCQVERRKKLIKAAKESDLVKQELYLTQLAKVAKNAAKEGVSSYTRSRTESTLNVGTDIALGRVTKFYNKINDKYNSNNKDNKKNK